MGRDRTPLPYWLHRANRPFGEIANAEGRKLHRNHSDQRVSHSVKPPKRNLTRFALHRRRHLGRRRTTPPAPQPREAPDTKGSQLGIKNVVSISDPGARKPLTILVQSVPPSNRTQTITRTSPQLREIRP